MDELYSPSNDTQPLSLKQNQWVLALIRHGCINEPDETQYNTEPLGH